uniref:VWFA domain-containing protein n=1 Tax=Biomphalaria glabrata TaxID=6526 RepID=A0A2C9K6G8_BIOGL
FVKDVIGGAGNALNEVATGTGNFVKDVVGSGTNVVGKVVETGVGAVDKVVSGTGTAVGQILEGNLGGALGTVAGTVLDTGFGILGGGVDIFGNIVSDTLTIGKNVLGSVVDTGVVLFCAVGGLIVDCRKAPGSVSVAPLPFQCRGKSDVIIVIDASGSVGSLNFKKQLSFAANLAGAFLIGPNNARFGVVGFSTNYQKWFNLNQYNAPVEVMQAILRTPYSAGVTATDKALNSIIDNKMFDAANGGRPDAKDIVIVLTDGQSDKPSATQTAANKLRSRGAIIFSVGIGLGNNKGELVSIAGNEENVFNADDFDLLNNVLYQLAQRTCAASGSEEKPVVVEPPIEVVPPECQAQADVIYVVDASGSIGPKNYKKVQQFTVDIAKSFRIGKNEVQFGSVIFSSVAQKWFDLKDNRNIAQLRRALLSGPYFNSTTRTDKALDLIRSENMFGRSAGGRDAAQKIVILLTDGASDDKKKTLAAANKLKNNDVNIIAVGVGNAELAELRAVASSNDDVLFANTFDALDKVKDQVIERTCE